MGGSRVEEPNFIAPAEKTWTPNDPLYSSQWHLNNTQQNSFALADADVDAPEGWDISKGDNMIIAVLDDGVETTHEDLAIWTNSAETPSNGIDDDGNGYIDDVNGWDFADDDNDPNPALSSDNHGTSAAGVAAATGNNSTGVSGAAPNAEILPIRMGSACADYGNSIRYAGMYADVLNNSWSVGFTCRSQINAAISDVYRGNLSGARRGAKGSPVLFSAGNKAGGWRFFYKVITTTDAHTFTWKYTKNASNSAGYDTVWLDNITWPDSSVTDFESEVAGTCPSGYTCSGAANWTVVADDEHAWNAGGQSVRAGAIADSEETVLSITKNITTTGMMSFWVWTSSEYAADYFEFWVDGGLESQYAPGQYGEHVNETTYPASYQDAIAIGSSHDGLGDVEQRSDYSQFGPEVDVVASSNGGAAGIYTTDRTGADGYDGTSNYYDNFGGTSSAAPLASGVAAVILSYNPALSAAQLRTVLRNSADKIGPHAYVNGRNDYMGYGRINLYNALTLATAPELDVLGNSLEIQTGDSTPATMDYTDFGAVAANGTAVTRTFVLENNGTAVLSLSGSPSVTISGTHATDFTVTQQPGSSVAAGSSDSVDITFTPDGLGVRTATVTITSDDADESSYQFAIQGNGVMEESVCITNGTFNGSTGWTNNGTGTLNYSAPLEIIGSSTTPGDLTMAYQSIDFNGANLVFTLLSFVPQQTDTGGSVLDYPLIYVDASLYYPFSDGTLSTTPGSGMLYNDNPLIEPLQYTLDVEAVAGTGNHTVGFAVVSNGDAQTATALYADAFCRLSTDYELQYSADTFTEGSANDGSSDTVLTLTLAGGETFTGTNGQDLVDDLGAVTVTNLPAGMGVDLIRQSDTEVQATLTGNAGSHTDSDDVADLTFTFSDGAFAGGKALAVLHAVKNNLSVNFSTMIISLSPAGGSTLSGSSEIFTWQATGVQQWWLTAGTAPGLTDLFDSGNLGTATSVEATGLSVDGSTVYVRLWYHDGTLWQYTDYSYTAATVTPAITSPTTGSTLSGPDVTFTWDGTGLVYSWLYAGTAVGFNNLFDSGGLGSATTVDVTGLPVDGSTIYVRLWYDNGSGAQHLDYTYTAATVSPTMTSPTDGSTLSGPAVIFTWQGAGVQHWWVYVGSVAGRNDYFDSGDLATDTTVNVTGIPVDGSMVYVRLWYHNGSIWQALDYSYTANTVAPSMTDPLDGSTLAGPDVTFTWEGAGVQQWWLYIGTTAGTKNLFDSGDLGTTTSANVTGLPQNGSTVYVRLWYNDGSGVWKKVDYTYTAAGP